MEYRMFATIIGNEEEKYTTIPREQETVGVKKILKLPEYPSYVISNLQLHLLLP
jgi:hypothetical protein